MRQFICIVVSAFFLFTLLLPNHLLSAPETYKTKQKNQHSSVTKKQHVPIDKSRKPSTIKSKRIKSAKFASAKKKKSAVRTAKTAGNSRFNEIAITENDGEFIEYKTKKGDTVEMVAMKFNVDKNDILEANNLTGKYLPPKKIVLIPRITAEEEDEKYDEIITLTNRPLKSWKSNDEKYMLVKVAKSFVGAPYKYGGESVKGLDCSAYVKKIYDIFDVQLPRSAREQYKIGVKINQENLAIGDLVFFKTKRYATYPTHVGIFIGDGKFIHSSSGQHKLGVKIDSLSSSFYSRTYMGATRVKQNILDDTGEEIENTTDNS